MLERRREMAHRIRVAVVDDHPLFRAGVLEALGDPSEFEIVGEAETAEDAIELARRESPEILLLDLGIPGSGLKAAGTVTASYPSTRVVILTSSSDEENVEAAMKAGARGYILKGVGGRELTRILREVMAGQIYVSPQLSNSANYNSIESPRT
jgi:two-component system, NarL family, nitrate/nitrite response regulator NarL